ncbi:hypothetical protein DY467_07695 [Rhodopseudomonas sp. BR0G17]|nr:hypothetical protein [Rhodopseudomonas sp. BR0G17]
MRNRIPATLAALLLATTCGACSTLVSERPQPAPPRVPDDCKALGKPVPLPAPREGADLGVIAAQNRAIAVTANRRIVGRDRCEAKTRAALKGGSGNVR